MNVDTTIIFLNIEIVKADMTMIYVKGWSSGGSWSSGGVWSSVNGGRSGGGGMRGL